MMTPTTAAFTDSNKPMPSIFRHWANATALTAFILIFAGGLVTSTGSGLAVPDWPLSFGQFFPAMIGGVFFEHGHRIIAGTTGLMTLILVMGISVYEKRSAVRRAAWAVAGGIIVQAILGGLTVLMKLPPAVSIAHGCLGQSVFCLLIVIADSFSADATEESITALPRPKYWKMLLAALGAVFIQLLLGAIVRHAHTMVMFHLFWALAVTLKISMVASQLLGDSRWPKSLSGPAFSLAILIFVQLALGIGSLWITTLEPTIQFSWRMILPTLHVSTGAAIMAIVSVLTWRAWQWENNQ